MILVACMYRPIFIKLIKREVLMTKSRDTQKETKKKSEKSLKEKRKEKKDKKAAKKSGE
jgi:hypothetical protein